MKKKFDKEDLFNLLVKKAKGFYYHENQYEYEKTQKCSKKTEKPLSKHQNINFFENYVMPGPENDEAYDKIKVSDEEPSNQQESENLTLAKKKITARYVPPDMLAIKMLFEIFGKKVGDADIKNMSDEELLSLKKKLIEEIKDEDC